MRYAIIDSNNNVVNVIIYTGLEGPWSPPVGCIMVASNTANITDIYNPATGTFTPCDPPVPIIPIIL